MKITGISVKPEKKSADIWDAVTETSVKNSTARERAVHLKTYIQGAGGVTVGKTETDFTAKPLGSPLAVQSVLTYSPQRGYQYSTVCELYEEGNLLDRQKKDFVFPF